jgi:elongation factor P
VPQLAANELRKGMLVDLQGKTATITHWNIWKSDRRSKIQLRFKEILTGRTSESTVLPDDRFLVLESEVVDISHSYQDGTDEVFFTDAGEEWRCPSAGLEEVLKWQAPAYRGLVVDGRLVTVTLPSSLVLAVADTTPSVKGIPNATKDAVLENGITVKVGLFINVGDRVRIDTETLEVKERVNTGE